MEKWKKKHEIGRIKKKSCIKWYNKGMRKDHISPFLFVTKQLRYYGEKMRSNLIFFKIN